MSKESSSHYTEPVHGWDAEGREVTASFGRDDTSKAGHTLLSDGHKSREEFSGERGNRGHDHYDGKGGGTERGQYNGYGSATYDEGENKKNDDDDDYYD